MSPSSAPPLSDADYLRDILRAPVYEVAIISPLENLVRLSQRFDNKIQLKREDRQVVHSFKLRGAYNMMAQLSPLEREAGVITASAGNHAQGVALAGKKLGIDTLIVMPKNTPDIKINAACELGGKIILQGQTFDEAKSYALKLGKKEKRTFIPPFDHPAIIVGQGTIGMELLQQNGHLDYIFLPVGGGGLCAGVAVLIKQLMPHILIIGVEAKGSACLKAAFKAQKPIELKQVDTFAEGVAVKKIGSETFRLCQAHLDGLISVSNDQICAAVQDIFEDTRAISEPSGALSLAGVKAYIEKHQLKNKRIACILSGANTNFHSLRYISSRAELGEKREALLAVSIPEQKGAFLALCKIIGERAISEFNYRFTKAFQARVFIGVKMQQGRKELDDLIVDLQAAHYEVLDLSYDEMAKEHVRYMIGGRPDTPIQERLYNFEFPECSGALLRFLNTMGTKWNISLFHYRDSGAEFGRVLCGFELQAQDIAAFNLHLQALGYKWQDETDNMSYRFFLAKDSITCQHLDKLEYEGMAKKDDFN